MQTDGRFERCPCLTNLTRSQSSPENASQNRHRELYGRQTTIHVRGLAAGVRLPGAVKRFCRLPGMQPNHLNLAVPDVLETRKFFETYFGFRDIEGVKPTKLIAVMTDDSGFILTFSNFTKTTEVQYPEGFHVGFIQESPERVNEIQPNAQRRRLRCRGPAQFPRLVDVLLPCARRLYGRDPEPPCCEVVVCCQESRSACDKFP